MMLMIARNILRSLASRGLRLLPEPPLALRVRAAGFSGNRRGNVAVLFAISVVPMIGLLGAAADYSSVQGQRARLNAVADSAALTAVGAQARTLSTDDAKARAKATLEANLAADPSLKIDSYAIEVVDAGVERSVVVNYTATYETSFMRLYGYATLAISGTATAKGPLAPYIDFYLLLDNTPSMGLGATTKDIDTLVNNTGDKCAFACHQMDSPGTDYYALAKKLKVQMRIDVVRSATQSLMDTAESAKIRNNQFRMAIYSLGEKAEEAGLKQIQKLTASLATAKSAANALDLMTIPYGNFEGDTQTNFDTAFDKINAEISKPGDGSKAKKPQKILFFVSDGVNDANKSSCSKKLTYSSDAKTKKSFERCMEPLNPVICKSLKDRGIKIAVLYTTYFPLPTNGWYNTWIKPFQPDIGTNMKACASDGLYFEVGPSQGISEAMNALFLKSVNQVTLTQ
jgi:Flp pilus assembly protein TadG